MTLIINGQHHELAGPVTVARLLKDLGTVPERVAIMVNDRIISRSARDETCLKDQDRVEILTFVGGG